MRSDYCPIANEPCQCMCLGDCQLRRLKPAGEEDMRVYRAIASNYETEKTRMTDTITVPRALLEQFLREMERTNEKTLAQFGVGMIDLNVITAMRSALEQPQQEDPELLTAYLYGFEKGRDTPLLRHCLDLIEGEWPADDPAAGPLMVKLRQRLGVTP